MSTAKALARLLELNMTQASYVKMRQDALDCNADIWPPYTQVQALKKLCLPKDILYKDDEVVVTLQVSVNKSTYKIQQTLIMAYSSIMFQDTVNHQIVKICELNPDMVEEIQALVDKGAKIVFYYKYGGGQKTNFS